MSSNNGLSSMSVKDLRALKARVEMLIAEKEVEERAQVRAKIMAFARDHGFELHDLLGKRRYKLSTVRYRNPKDHTQTWSGRGRRPAWMGKRDPNEFRV